MEMTIAKMIKLVMMWSSVLRLDEMLILFSGQCLKDDVDMLLCSEARREADVWRRERVRMPVCHCAPALDEVFQKFS